jgi:exodeoxyribonuclease-5
MRWSPQQEDALSKIGRWLKSRDQVFLLFGYAGTGKTQIAHEIGRSLGDVVYCAFTGKAAHVLRQRGCKPTSTIHQLIYRPVFDADGHVKRWDLRPRSELAHLRLIIVDESSMINEALAGDLLSFGIKLLIIADPAQLPPINGGGYFMDFEPDAMLTEIHRQARDNPILLLADQIRRGKKLPARGSSDRRLVIAPIIDDPENYDTILCGTHEMRHRLNRRMRVDLGYHKNYEHRVPPKIGEIIVCTRNDYSVDAPIYNGQQWEIEGLKQVGDPRVLPILEMALRQGDAETLVNVPLADFTGEAIPLPPWRLQHLQRFEFGYALTVHKAQGSEWDSVLMINESGKFRSDMRQWLYTGITRARERLTIVRAV